MLSGVFLPEISCIHYLTNMTDVHDKATSATLYPEIMVS